MSRSSSVGLLSIVILALLGTASAITVELDGTNGFCFYKDLHKDERFIGSYVVSGYHETAVTSFVAGPNQVDVLYTNEQDREGYWDVKAEETGEYRACFRNLDDSENYLSLVVYTENEINAFADTHHVTPASIDYVGYSLNETFVQLREISDNLNFQRTREQIHGDNLETLDSKITWSAFMKVLSLVAIAAGQAYILTGMFKVKGKNLV